jgi:hypothetical protein
MELRDYQQRGVTVALDAMLNRYRRVLFTSPTGSGKSYIQLAVRRELKDLGHDPVILSPSVEIIEGLCSKLGVSPKIAEQQGIFTPQRFLRRVELEGASAASHLIVDEAHHDAAPTYRMIYKVCPVPRCGFTATPFRINPAETAAFLEQWDEQVDLLSWVDAVNHDYISIPRIETVPLVDDDLLELGPGGELRISQVEKATANAMKAMVLALEKRGFFEFKRVAVATLPSVGAVENFKETVTDQLGSKAGKLVVSITAETSPTARRRSLKSVAEGKALLAHVNIVGEGVDLPVRLMADAAPTMSPVRFIQRFGRACRPLQPDEDPGLYVVFNRNLQHHGYILSDVMPEAYVREAAEAFPTGFTSRGSLRSAGIDTFGRIKPVEIQCASGDAVHLYVVNRFDESGVKSDQIALIIHPMEMDPFWFRRTLPEGKWARYRKPDKFKAVAAAGRGPVTMPMLAWWEKQAERFGLSKDQPLDSKVFQILPILANSNLSLRV